jgi:hypothetical protein
MLTHKAKYGHGEKGPDPERARGTYAGEGRRNFQEVWGGGCCASHGGCGGGESCIGRIGKVNW